MVTMALAALLLAVPGEGDPRARLIARAQSSELLEDPLKMPRVVRDDDGHVTSLRLDGMRLSEDEFKALGKMTALRTLALNGTNITDADLAHLQSLVNLQGLMLNRTEVTDAAVDEFVKLPALRTLCLGSVRITPEAIERLQEQFAAQKRRLSLGYSPRE
jgi:hypothetical protein